MSYAILAACLWAVAANVPILPGLRHAASVRLYGLVAAGVPILGWVVLLYGPLIGLLLLAAGAACLRWPLMGVLSKFGGSAAGQGAKERGSRRVGSLTHEAGSSRDGLATRSGLAQEGLGASE